MIYECDRLRSNLWHSIAVNVLVTTVMTDGHYCDDQMQIYDLLNNNLWPLLVIIPIVFFVKDFPLVSIYYDKLISKLYIFFA